MVHSPGLRTGYSYTFARNYEVSNWSYSVRCWGLLVGNRCTTRVTLALRSLTRVGKWEREQVGVGNTGPPLPSRAAAANFRSCNAYSQKFDADLAASHFRCRDAYVTIQNSDAQWHARRHQIPAEIDNTKASHVHTGSRPNWRLLRTLSTSGR